MYNGGKINNELRSQVFELRNSGQTYKQIGLQLNIKENTARWLCYTEGLRKEYGDGFRYRVSAPRARHLLGIDYCELCGYDRAVDVAHIVERRNGGDTKLDNLIILCPNCHHLFDHNALTEIETNHLMTIGRIQNKLKERWNVSRSQS